MTKKQIFTLSSATREGIRSELINIFLQEEPGTGKGDLASKYHYTVETITCGGINHFLVLKRPAHLNKGFDFTVTYDGHNFNKDLTVLRKSKNKPPKMVKAPSTAAPSHNHICSDLRLKKEENSLDYHHLKKMIDDIYKCKVVSDADYKAMHSKFKSGLPVEVLLKLIKWLFIEQDMTYWNYSGRNMLYGCINGV